MNETQSQPTCHNPACRKPVVRRLAYLRSISLEQVAFCSKGCVAMFDELDAADGHHRIPAQRSASGESLSA